MAVAQQPRPLGIQVLPLEDVRPGNNYRKTFDPERLAELAKSIAAQGVLQPIKVRPVPDPEGADPRPQYEVVFGERRYRAARDAGHAEIPAIVEDLTDEQVIEQQLEENNARDDVHPLEECIAFERLRDEFGRSADEIAAKVGKSKSYVYARLKYEDLGPEGRKAFLAGDLDASKALLIARIPAALQAQAVDEIMGGQWDEPMSYREAAAHVRAEYMLNLKGAPFDIKSADLVPDVGACGPCPKRTGSAPDLFGDVDSGDVCTDIGCYRLKAEAAWEQKASQAMEKGATVLDKDLSARLLWETDLNYEGERQYVKLTDVCPTDKKGRTYAKILGSWPEGVVVARSRKGTAVKLYPKGKLKAAVKEAAPELEPPPARPAPAAGANSYAEQQKERRKKTEIARLATHEALREIAVAATVKDVDGFWQLFLAPIILDDANHDTVCEVAKARGVYDPKKASDTRKVLAGEIKAGNEQEAMALAIQLLAGAGGVAGPWHSRAFLPPLVRTCEVYGIDLKALHKEAKAAAKEKSKPKGKKVGKAAAAKNKARARPQKSRLPTCTVKGCKRAAQVGEDICPTHFSKKVEADRDARTEAKKTKRSKVKDDEPRTCKRPECDNAVPGRKRLCAVHEGTRP